MFRRYLRIRINHLNIKAGAIGERPEEVKNSIFRTLC